MVHPAGLRRGGTLPFATTSANCGRSRQWSRRRSWVRRFGPLAAKVGHELGKAVVDRRLVVEIEQGVDTRHEVKQLQGVLAGSVGDETARHLECPLK